MIFPALATRFKKIRSTAAVHILTPDAQGPTGEEMIQIKNLSDAELDERYAALRGGDGEEGKAKPRYSPVRFSWIVCATVSMGVGFAISLISSSIEIEPSPICSAIC